MLGSLLTICRKLLLVWNSALRMNLTFVIKEDVVADVIKKLHQEFFVTNSEKLTSIGQDV